MEFREKVEKAKNLFNDYSAVKDIYPDTPGTETALKSTLTLFLQQVTDICRELKTLSESKIERDLFKQFAGELTIIFK